MAVLRKLHDGRYEIDYGTMIFSLDFGAGFLTATGGGSSSIVIDDRDWDDYVRQAGIDATALFQKGEVTEELYVNKTDSIILVPIVIEINDEIKRHLAKNPEKLRQLPPDKFEKLVADLLKHSGYDVELTPAGPDGGIDIYAYMKNPVCAFLMFVECKRYQPPNRVGLQIVQRMFGIQQTKKANKSMIVTTSFFTRPAIEEARRYENLMTLADYDDLRRWLKAYE
ncbi:MAG: restriction endonuclease [Syntrophorhabdales bacterium]|jgi:restriction endonuclease Mrr